MKAITKLKTQARLHEQREEWEKAAQLYLQALAAGEEAAEDQDLSLYNRVGDLYLRLRRPNEAVQYFQEAADRYAAAGLYNNAIALCNKALRQAPEELELYRKLGHYYALQGFLPDARRWYLDYAERQIKLGAQDAAFTALAQFAETTNNAEVRESLGRVLETHGRHGEAVQELSRAYRMRTANGEDDLAEALREEIARIDPEAAAALSADPVPVVTPGSAVEEAEPPALDGIAIESAADAAGFKAEPAPSTPVPVDDSLDVEPIPLDFQSNLEEFRLQGALDAPAREPVEAPPLADLEGVPADLGLGEGFAEIEPLPLVDLERDDVDDPEAASAAAIAGLDFGTLDAGEAEADEDEDLPSFLTDLPLLDDGDPAAGEDDASAWADLPTMEVSGLDAGELVSPPTGTEDDEADDAPAEDLPLLEVPGFEADVAAPFDAQAPEAIGDATDLPMLEVPDLDAGAPLDDAAPALGAVPDLDGAISYARMLERRGEVDAAADTLKDLHEDLAAAGRFAEAAEAAAELIRLRPDDEATREVHGAYLARAGEPATAAAADPFDAGLPPEDDAGFGGALFPVDGGLDLELDGAPPPAAGAEPGAAEAEGEGSPPPDPAGHYVDLGDLLARDDEEPGSTRFTVVARVPTGDEDQDFAEVLAEFRSRIEETIGEDDPDSHYDLGLAFKEMGLLDEAITQFQSALRGVDDRLKVFEELGQCFIQKGQFKVAVIILRRALELPHDDIAALKNVYYLLGRCLETLGETGEAREAYERVIGLDIRFEDAAERLARL
ncbi:MAG TPA: tetratricopeptide repeat protein [Longimicrobiales bacterium]|nr:tetratricopeptide repeat protein [Longimicrobiales bacterium]